MPHPETQTGIVLIDHGSRNVEANQVLVSVAALFREKGEYALVEPAHMELAEPTLEQAVSRCIAQGASRIIVQPYFLTPGRHSSRDIPAMTAALAAQYPDIIFAVGEPLGVHPALAEVLADRIRACAQQHGLLD